VKLRRCWLRRGRPKTCDGLLEDGRLGDGLLEDGLLEDADRRLLAMTSASLSWQSAMLQRRAMAPRGSPAMLANLRLPIARTSSLKVLPSIPMRRRARATGTRWCSVAGAALVASLVASIAHAQTPLGPLLPPVPVPPMPLPTTTWDGGDAAPTPLPAAPVSPFSPPRASIAGLVGSPVVSAISPDERRAWRRSQLHEVWYGWQTLAVDAAAVALLAFEPAFDARLPSRAPSIGVYAIGPAVIHFSHGSVGKGLGSLALRIAMPFLGFRFGNLLSESLQWPSGSGMEASAVGALVGGAGAMALDATLIGWDRWQGVERTGRILCFAASSSF
jgi:hypothetical protein